jgi:hypothetical protein
MTRRVAATPFVPGPVAIAGPSGLGKCDRIQVTAWMTK